MTALVTFLTARLDEDEAVARASKHADGPETLEWRPGGRRTLRFDNGRREDYSCVFAGNWARIMVARDYDAPLAAHIARHDPARVLAEVDAKRRIVGAVLNYESWMDHETGCCHDAAEIRGGYCERRSPDEIDALRILALPHAEHQDYDERWRP